MSELIRTYFTMACAADVNNTLRLHRSGHGGRHRDGDESRRYRELLTEIQTNLRACHPLMYRGIVVDHAIEYAKHISFSRERIDESGEIT